MHYEGFVCTAHITISISLPAVEESAIGAKPYGYTTSIVKMHVLCCQISFYSIITSNEMTRLQPQYESSLERTRNL